VLTASDSVLTGKNWLRNYCSKSSQDQMGKTLVSASWQKRFSDHFAARLSLKKTRVQKIFSSLQLNCSGAKRKYNVQELRKARLELHSPDVTNFIRPYLHLFFDDSHGLKASLKPLRRPFDRYQSRLEAISIDRDIRQINW